LDLTHLAVAKKRGEKKKQPRKKGKNKPSWPVPLSLKNIQADNNKASQTNTKRGKEEESILGGTTALKLESEGENLRGVPFGKMWQGPRVGVKSLQKWPEGRSKGGRILPMPVKNRYTQEGGDPARESGQNLDHDSSDEGAKPAYWAWRKRFPVIGERRSFGKKSKSRETGEAPRNLMARCCFPDRQKGEQKLYTERGGVNTKKEPKKRDDSKSWCWSYVAKPTIAKKKRCNRKVWKEVI